MSKSLEAELLNWDVEDVDYMDVVQLTKGKSLRPGFPALRRMSEHVIIGF